MSNDPASCTAAPEPATQNMSMQQLLEKQRLDIKRVLDVNNAICELLTADAKLTNAKYDQVSLERKQGSHLGTGSLHQPLLRKTTSGFHESEDQNPSDARRAPGQTRSRVVSHILPDLSGFKKVIQHSLHDSSHEHVYDRNVEFWHSLTTSQWFQMLSLVMIFLNIIWVGVETDLNHAVVLSEAPLVFQIVDNIFCVYFVIELTARFLAFPRSQAAIKDWCFVFDLVLVLLMVWETWVEVLLFELSHKGYGTHSFNWRSISALRIFRMGRISRVVRIGRSVRHIPEFVCLVNSMAIAVRSVVSVLGLLGLAVYVFAIILSQLLEGTDLGYDAFSSIPSSANFLLLQTVCGFNPKAFMQMLEVSWMCYTIYLIYYIITSLTLINMMTGLLVEIMRHGSDEQKANFFEHQVELQVVEIAQRLDVDRSESISYEECMTVLKDKEVLLELAAIGADVPELIEFMTFLFKNCDELSFDEFKQAVLRFRCLASDSNKDVLRVQKHVSQELAALEDRLHRSFTATRP